MTLFSKLRKKPFTFKRITGLSLQEFDQIMKKLRPAFQKKHIKSKKLAGRPYGINPVEGQLICLLIYYRTYSTQFFIGLLFKVDAATICRTIRRIEPILAKITRIKKERKISQKELETLIIDCTEQPIRRPTKRQKKWYSGKKKRHTIKTEVLITDNGKICEISKPHPGKMHDIEVRRRGKPLPVAREILADSGYQGLQKQHKNIRIPLKKSKTKPLGKQARKHNKELSKRRILVENKIGQMKVFQILAQTYRNKLASYSLKTGIIAGLVNMKNGF